MPLSLRLEKSGHTFLLNGQALARGGEATIYPVPEQPALVAKVYHQPTEDHAAKVAAMLAAPPADPMAGRGHVSIAWPVDRLLEAASPRFLGYVMPRVDKVRPLLEFYNPGSRLQLCPLFHYGYLLRTARNLAAAVRALHERGYVIGDLNESNILVSNMALVTLVDTDSFQVPAGGRVRRCPVGKPEYTPPELQGARFADFDRGPKHDAFALAILVFQLLMGGVHPFAGRYTGAGEPAGLGERIAAGHWPYAKGRRVPYAPNPHAPPFETLPPALQDLMRRCFEDGHVRSSLRPDAAAWHQALLQSEKELAPCPANPKQHVFPRGLKACPWCAMARVQGRDLFPSAEDVQAGRVGKSTVAPKAPEPVQVPLAPAPMSRDYPGGPGSAPASAPIIAWPLAEMERAPRAAAPATKRPSDLPPPAAIPVGGSRPSGTIVLPPLSTRGGPAADRSPVPSPRRVPLWVWLAGGGGLGLILLIVILIVALGGKKPEAGGGGPGSQKEKDLANKGPAEKINRPASKLFPKGPVRFLSDLPEQDVHSGEWPFRKGDTGNGQPIRVNGVLSPHGLGMHPPAAPGYASVRYELDKEAALFKATVAINDTTKWCWSPATFTVLGDGKELWKSAAIAHNHARSQECQVVVKGVNWLELRVQVLNGNQGVEAVWVEPRVLQNFDSPDQVGGPEGPDKNNSGGKAEAGESGLDPAVAAFVRKSVLDRKYTRTNIVGRNWGEVYEEVPPEGGLLVGFELGLFKFGNGDVINSIQPIYRTAKGEIRGQMRGKPTGRSIILKARKGYAVGAVTLTTALQINGMKLTYMRVEKTFLDSQQTYQSEEIGLIGSRRFGTESTIGGSGNLVIGICGKSDPDISRSLGLVLRRAGD